MGKESFVDQVDPAVHKPAASSTSEARHGQPVSSAHEQLYQWIAERRGEDYCLAQIFIAIRNSGWGAEAAAAALRHVMGDEVEQREIDALVRGCPWPDLSHSPSAITVQGHEVQVLMEVRNPRIVLFGGLLTDDECDEFMALAEPRLQRSRYSQDGGKANGVGDARTSHDAYLWRADNYDVVNRVDARVQALLGWPIGFTEDWQVIKYDQGSQFKPHHDCFGPDIGPWNPWLRRGGHRCGTLIIYLKAPLLGGSTAFPQVPMDVLPRKGSAVFFAYPYDAVSRSRTMHAGSPVIEGEKWSAVKWFRQGPHH